MPSPVRKRPAGGSVRARRLLAIRPTSIAAKKAVREVAAAGRVRPVSSARKSAPQYPTHHSEATPSATSVQNAQESGGRVGPSAGASSLAAFGGRARVREKKRAAS